MQSGKLLEPAGRPSFETRILVAITVFYAVAIVVSFMAAQLGPLKALGGFRIDPWLLVGLGPLAGTIAACLLLRQKLPSLFGRNLSVGAVALLAPVILTGFVGFGGLATAGATGLIFGLSIVVYCVCEEIGWRGFLTGNLGWLKEWQGDLLTGALWFAWHLTFMPELRNPSYTIGFVAAIVAGAFGLAEARRRTGGYALAVGWHAAVKLLPIGALAYGLLGFLLILTWRSKKVDQQTL
jgi:membrane protease YdiL (CAAX protease family)